MRPTRTIQQNGYVMVVVISILAILMTIGLAFAGFAYYGIQRTAAVRDSMQAYYAARAGVSHVMRKSEIKTKDKSTNNTDTTTFNLTMSTGQEIILQSTDESTTSNLKIHAFVTWKSVSYDILGVGANAIEITSCGIVETPSKIRAERTLRVIADPSIQKIYYFTELPTQAPPSESKPKKGK